MLGSRNPTQHERGCVIVTHSPLIIRSCSVRHSEGQPALQASPNKCGTGATNVRFQDDCPALPVGCCDRVVRARNANACRGRGQHPAHCDPVLLRPSARCEHGALLHGRKGRTLRRRASLRLLQSRHRLVGGAGARREGRQRSCARRHQRVDPLPRQERCAAGESRVHAVQQLALRDRRPQEPRRACTVGPRRQDGRRCRQRSVVPAVALARAAKQNQRRPREILQDERGGARADPVRRSGRCRHRLLPICRR